jgi:regulatory protein YycI of two-component signal transduction system YycFG
MGYAILNNSPAWQMTKSVYLNAGLVITVFAVYAFFWVKFKMKKGIFEAEPIEEAIAD